MIEARCYCDALLEDGCLDAKVMSPVSILDCYSMRYQSLLRFRIDEDRLKVGFAANVSNCDFLRSTAQRASRDGTIGRWLYKRRCQNVNEYDKLSGALVFSIRLDSVAFTEAFSFSLRENGRETYARPRRDEKFGVLLCRPSHG